MATPLLLVDASIYIFRAYFSMPDHWHSEDGVGTGAVYGYCQFLLSLLEKTGASQLACCYDESLTQCFRNQVYPAYKANRELPDQDLAFQLKACRELSSLIGIPSYASAEYEADDLIGSLLAWIKGQRLLRASPVAVVTRDKDLGQLIIDPEDYLWDFAADARFYRPDIFDKFGVNPEQLTDYLALVGDSVDNIPGVPGVGPKTAAALLAEFPDIETVFANLDSLANMPIRGAKSLAGKLSTHLEQIALAKMLATIVCDAPLENCAHGQLSRQWLTPQAPQWQALERFCQTMGFPRAFTRMQKVLNRA
ncbi:5'-3' exonuclease [Halioxenophilus aromaticivorans]|uniref:5'-3' exonuclease H3TH domain-containing protein n=1 Tax=Halioxenophilus aromaticivorans TaxID=1306992 RepID=A0AAV3U5M0_9ALTE